MELHLLEKYVAVAEELHFGKAAARLNMSQPPLSQAVQRLEEELGVTLLQRDRRNVRLTTVGEDFLADARNILTSLDAAVLRARMAGEGRAGRLAVGLVGPAAHTGFPALLQRFCHSFPDVALDLRELPTLKQLGLLETGELQVGVVRLFGDASRLRKGLSARLMHREPYVLAVPESHPLARQEVVRLEDLAAVPLIAFPRKNGPELYDALVTACRNAGFEPRYVQEAARKSTTMAYVGAGVGAAFMPRSSASMHVPGVVCLPLEGTLHEVRLYFVWNEKIHDPVRDRFLAFASNEFPDEGMG